MATLMSTLILTLLCGFVLASSLHCQTIDMTNMCDKTVNLTFAQLLIGRPVEDTLMPNSECKIQVRVQPEHRMIISLQSKGDSVSGIICVGNNISMQDIPDSDPHYTLPLSEREFCKEITTDNDVVSTSDEVTINFYSNIVNNTDIRVAFQFLLIPFHLGVCGSFENKCSNNRCIESSMVCMENYNNCSSGECRNYWPIVCDMGCSPRWGSIFFPIIVFIILIVACVCCGWLWRRRRQKLRKNTRVVETKESHSATTEPTFISVTTAPAYTPPYAPPVYSTLPRKHPEVADNNKGKLEEMFKEGKENTGQNDNTPPPYQE